MIHNLTGICKKYGVSRKVYYNWKNRYDDNGIDDLPDLSRVSGTIKYKVDTATEETILDLRLKRFGCNRIRFRLERLGVYLSSRTICKISRRHCLNILKYKIKNRKCRRFAMKHPNDTVQWISSNHSIYTISARNYIISRIDDCSRKVSSKRCERRRSIDVLDVLEEWIMINGKPKKIMHDNGKQFTSKIFKRFLQHNNMRDNRIPNSYPQLQGKVEACNKIVKNEFISVEHISSIDEGKTRYDMFVKAYNIKRKDGGINGLHHLKCFYKH